MRRKWTLLLVAPVVLLLGASSVVRVLRPVCPGIQYPADPAKLYAAITQYLNQAEVEPRNGRLVAVIAPNAGYPFSGAVAAHAFKLLKPGQYDRVVVLCPSHYARFRGCSIASVQFHRTPFGDVPIDAQAVSQLCLNPLIDLRSVIYRQDRYIRGERVPVHEREHGIEVLLPFLQLQLGEFRIVGVVVGDLLDYNKEFDHNAAKAIAETLRHAIDDRTLLIVSTNLTQFGPEFGYTPFQDDALRRVGQLDMEALELILNKDYDGFQAYIEGTGNNFSGRGALSILLELLPPQAIGTVLSYDTSGRQKNDPTTSVSYASLVFFDPTLKPPEQKPVRTLIPKPEQKSGAG